MFFRVVYFCVLPILRGFFRLFFFARVTGREKILKNGGFVASANHISNFDPVFFGCFIPRKLNFLAKRELFENKFLGWLIGGLGAIPITRGGSDIGTLKTVISVLKGGGIMTVFPEGTRRLTDIEKVKPGAVLFAIKSKVPVQPAVIIGKYRLFGGIRLVFGDPIYYDAYYDKKLSEDELHRLSVELMQTIYGLAEGGA